MRERRFFYKLRHLLFFLPFTLFYCRPGIFFGKTLLSLGGDEQCGFYPHAAYFHEWVARGILPFWQMHAMCGHPYGFAVISFLDLYHVAAAIFPTGLAYSLAKISGVFLGAVFLAHFLQRKGSSIFSSWIGGLVWFFYSSRSIESGFFFLPLLFLLGDHLAERKTRPRFFFFVLALAGYALNANPHFFLYGTLLLFSYLFWTAFHNRRFKDIFHYLTAGVLAVGICSFHFFRLFETAGLSNRSSWLSPQTLLPTHYLLALFPDLFSISGRPDLIYVMPRLLGKVVSHMPFLKIDALIAPDYVGIYPCVALIGWLLVWRSRKGDAANFFLGAFFAVVIYLTLHPFWYALVIRRIPFVGSMTNIGRVFELYAFCLAVLTSKFTDVLTARGVHNRKIPRSVGKFLLAMLIFVWAAANFVKISIHHFKDFVSRNILESLRSASHPTNFIQDPVSFGQSRVDDFFLFFDSLASFLNPHILAPAIFFALFFLIIRYWKNSGIRYWLARLGLIAVISADMMLVLGTSMPAAATAEIVPQSKWMLPLREDSSLFRVQMLEDPTRSFSAMPLRPVSNVSYGISTPDGYDQLYLARYVRFYRLLTRRPSGMPDFILHPMHDFERSLSNFANCRYFLTTNLNRRLDSEPDFEKISEDDSYCLYKNKQAFPRFFVVHQTINAKNTEEAEKLLIANKDRLRETVILEGDVTPSPSLKAISDKDREVVEVLRYGPNQIRLKTHVFAEGYLVMSESYAPGWRALIDNKPSRLFHANLAFRAVEVPAGEHEILLNYWPPSLTWGLLASGISIVLLVVILLFFA